MRAGEVAGPSSSSPSFREQERIRHAIHTAEAISGLRFSVYVGYSEDDPRRYALRLHSALPQPSRSVLVLCDPSLHALEIVTGEEARRTLTDLECRLAAAAMESSFIASDLVGGLVAGVSQMAEAARPPRMLHVSS